ncbi:MAG: hypothetical protein GC200_06490 [Tepidisphaera sp.]|nr:hypothetical protein [Tepidisphaera sp.]
MNARSMTALAGSTFLAVSMISAGLALAQVNAAPTPAVRTTGIPQRDTLIKMSRPVSIEFKDTRLEDAMKFIADVTQADLEVMWIDDRNTGGLDKEAQISIKADNISALSLLERVLEKATSGQSGASAATWQMSSSGAMQVGTKDRLNKYKRVQLYPIQDLILEVPNYTNAPEFDLQQVLQSASQRGGGSGQSPFRDTNNNNVNRRSPDDKTNDLVSLITSLVEPDQWMESGGDGGSIRAFQGTLIVNAPDYMHRGIDGYPYWPHEDTHVSTVHGRRYVSLGMDNANSTLTGFGTQDVTAVAGGQLVNSDPRKNPPGGSTTPTQPATKTPGPK